MKADNRFSTLTARRSVSEATGKF